MTDTIYNTPPGKLEDEWVYRHHPKTGKTSRHDMSRPKFSKMR